MIGDLAYTVVPTVYLYKDPDEKEPGLATEAHGEVIELPTASVEKQAPC